MGPRDVLQSCSRLACCADECQEQDCDFMLAFSSSMDALMFGLEVSRPGCSLQSAWLTELTAGGPSWRADRVLCRHRKHC